MGRTTMIDEEYSTGDATVLPSSVLKLEKMVSMKVAISLWTSLLPNNFEFDKVRELLPPLPELIVKQILGNFKDLVLNVRKWISYHFCEILLDHGVESDFNRFIGCIVWYPNGAIQQYSTALNLLKSAQLSDVEKYRLACTYCMEEEVENRWPAMIKNNSLDTLDIIRHPLIFYWNRHCDGSSKFIVPAYLSHEMSLNEYMIRNIHPDRSNWPAIEYFFDRLNATEQVACSAYYVDSCDAQCLRLILIKMAEPQRTLVYAKKAVNIIRNFVAAGGAEINEPNAISVWYEVCHSITEDEFVSLMNTLCEVANTDTVMVEIWKSAYDDFKCHLLRKENYDYVGHLMRWCCRHEEKRINFLFVVLDHRAIMRIQPRSSEHYEFLITLCQRLISRNNPQSATRLLKFCITDDVQRTQFKEILSKNLDHFEDKFLSSYATGNRKELNQQLSPLITLYPDVILEFERKLLFSERGLKICNDLVGSSTGLCSIVTDCLADDQLLKKFANEVILSNWAVRKLDHLIRRVEYLSNMVITQNVDLFLKSKREKRTLRFKLLSCLTPEELRDDPHLKKKYFYHLQTLFQ